MSFNKIIIVGNLGKDPELRYTPQSTAVANISVATTEKKRNSDGEYDNVTTWFRVTLWGKQAENAAKYLTKGSPVYLEGRLTIEEWTDRDNNNRFTLNVNATDMQFLSGGQQKNNAAAEVEDDGEEEEAPAPKKTKAAAATAGTKKKAAPVAADDDDDDLEF